MKSEYEMLVEDLRALSAKQRRKAAETAGIQLVEKAMTLCREGRIAPADVTRLHALRLRIEENLG